MYCWGAFQCGRLRRVALHRVGRRRIRKPGVWRRGKRSASRIRNVERRRTPGCNTNTLCRGFTNDEFPKTPEGCVVNVSPVCGDAQRVIHFITIGSASPNAGDDKRGER